MEEILSMIFNGINLVKELEFSLSPQESPESLSSSLGSISTLFGDANERLKILLARRNAWVPNQPKPKPVPVSGLDQMMMQSEPDLMQDYRVRQGEMQTGKSMDSGASCAFLTPRPRRRKKDGDEETVLVAAAARMGNMDTPPDDNYAWRKYGQKEILGSRFPRAYYRCTHQKLYKCPAKKQVQRLDEDPYTFRVTYRSSHTCHFFTTSPISSPAATATTVNVHYGPAVVNMAEAMLGNMESVVPFSEPYFNYGSIVPGDAGDGETWK
uniref:WRKY58 transcription factor n=1 Tax=Isatis tinctoria TaxID=161756 RepID=A0A6G8R7L4_ISATI|nr:WRKY58 transcription factor [Isatis tinctoria]